jgi:Beta-lactamase superfamily domain
MSDEVIYRQLNKDYAYWTEKRRLGQLKGGHVAGLLTWLGGGEVRLDILIDAGLGTLEAIADFCEDDFWDQPLVVFITHGHIDHHAELMVLSEIYCKRRSADKRQRRLPLQVYCTEETQKHLFATHRYGYTDGGTLKHRAILANSALACGAFKITPIAVDHFEGAVIYVVDFGSHRLVIGWDMRSLPLSQIEHLQQPSLALLEATTWTPMAGETGHISVEELVGTGFLEGLRLQFDPARSRYGAFLVHYSGWEDPWGMLKDDQLKDKFDRSFPELSAVVRVAERGQMWRWLLPVSEEKNHEACGIPAQSKTG